jgi:hypothetical protein
LRVFKSPAKDCKIISGQPARHPKNARVQSASSTGLDLLALVEAIGDPGSAKALQSGPVGVCAPNRQTNYICSRSAVFGPGGWLRAASGLLIKPVFEPSTERNFHTHKERQKRENDSCQVKKDLACVCLTDQFLLLALLTQKRYRQLD